MGRDKSPSAADRLCDRTSENTEGGIPALVCVAQRRAVSGAHISASYLSYLQQQRSAVVTKGFTTQTSPAATPPIPPGPLSAHCNLADCICSSAATCDLRPAAGSFTLPRWTRTPPPSPSLCRPACVEQWPSRNTTRRVALWSLCGKRVSMVPEPWKRNQHGVHVPTRRREKKSSHDSLHSLLLAQGNSGRADIRNSGSRSFFHCHQGH